MKQKNIKLFLKDFFVAKTLLLFCKGMPFQGSSTQIGDINNGNFLGYENFSVGLVRLGQVSS